MVNKDIMETQKFNASQKEQIRYGLKAGVDISQYADPKFNSRQMAEIRLGLEAGVDVSQYTDPKFDHWQMKKIRRELWEIREGILEGRELEDIEF